jgi:hypothetical protein
MVCENRLAMVEGRTASRCATVLSGPMIVEDSNAEI